MLLPATGFGVQLVLAQVPASSSPFARIATWGALSAGARHKGVQLPLYFRQTNVAPKSKYAFATIFYEIGLNDDEYFLGARVALNSVNDGPKLKSFHIVVQVKSRLPIKLMQTLW